MTGIVDKLERFLLTKDVFLCIANVVDGRDNDVDRSRPRVSNVLFISCYIQTLFISLEYKVYCEKIYMKERKEKDVQHVRAQ